MQALSRCDRLSRECPPQTHFPSRSFSHAESLHGSQRSLDIRSANTRGLCPTRPGRGNPLVMPEWIAAVEIDLSWIRTALHKPCAVLVLVLQQKSNALPIQPGGGGSPGLVQRIQRFSGCIRIRLKFVALRPSAIRALPGTDLLSGCVDVSPRSFGPYRPISRMNSHCEFRRSNWRI